MNLADLRTAMAKIKASAKKPHPATLEECRVHNRIMAEQGRPDLTIMPGELVYSMDEILGEEQHHEQN